VRFTIQGKQFAICTNRTDLNTLQIIVCYAYRWQIELMFKFLKRTMHGLHLFNQSENGVKIQFYCLLTLALLQLRLKQCCKR
jgi:IS4 transposase